MHPYETMVVLQVLAAPAAWLMQVLKQVLQAPVLELVAAAAILNVLGQNTSIHQHLALCGCAKGTGGLGWAVLSPPLLAPPPAGQLTPHQTRLPICCCCVVLEAAAVASSSRREEPYACA